LVIPKGGRVAAAMCLEVIRMNHSRLAASLIVGLSLAISACSDPTGVDRRARRTLDFEGESVLADSAPFSDGLTLGDSGLTVDSVAAIDSVVAVDSAAIVEIVDADSTIAADRLDVWRRLPLFCPNEEAHFATAIVDSLGGTIAVQGGSITIPPGAVSEPVEITISLPSSPYRIVDLRVTGYDSFRFNQPVSVTLDYSMCAGAAERATALGITYLASGTNVALEPTEVDDNRASQSITFFTWHFSAYSIAE
jgi:hypothetical protein